MNVTLNHEGPVGFIRRRNVLRSVRRVLSGPASAEGQPRATGPAS